jgi:transcriptional regulator with XRE-family HTH domain
MKWREELGEQIRLARARAGLTQLQLAEKTSVKREHISNIELGKNSPAVKIITDIAKALNARLHVDGCLIEPTPPETDLHPARVPEQMTLDLGVEYSFSALSVSLTAHGATEVELRAIFAEKRRA